MGIEYEKRGIMEMIYKITYTYKGNVPLYYNGHAFYKGDEYVLKGYSIADNGMPPLSFCYMLQCTVSGSDVICVDKDIVENYFTYNRKKEEDDKDAQ